MSKITLNQVTNGNNLSNLNDNFTKIADALNNKTLYRNNPDGEANQMSSNLDMNNQRVLNLPAPIDDNDAARLKDIKDAVAGAHTASLVEFSPYKRATSKNVQGAVQDIIDSAQASG